MLASTFDFLAYRTLVDVGGGSGGLAIAVTERHPHVRATVVDLPSVVSITEQLIAEAGAAGRVQAMGVDLLAEPLPPLYDVAVLSSFLQDFESESARRALINVGAGVRPGGTLCVIGAILDETRLAPHWGVWFNYAAISFYERGQAHTERECRGWLKEAGFDEIELHLEDSAEVQIIARKSG
jgi:hypothetical protein